MGATRHAQRPPIRIVHLGIGAFFRAFGLEYLERLNETISEPADCHGVLGVSFRSPAVRNALASQDFVYAAVERGTEGDIARTITSLRDVRLTIEEPEPILERMADPAVAIVSLTVTEKGYCHKGGALDRAHPDIVHDIANPAHPRSAPGYIVAALARRRDAGVLPFTCLSCDNLTENGRVLQRVVCGLAEANDPALSAWINAEVKFPATMVDRIVPATTEVERAEVEKLIGRKDRAPVVHEPFRQWVIEDDFGPLGRPDLEKVGVEMVENVAPHESMKLRCLNGSHTALAILGILHGKTTVSDAIADPLLSSFIDTLWEREICPSVRTPKGANIAEYCSALRRRYGNPAIVHPAAQIATDTSKKLPQRVLAPMAENLAAGRPVSRLCLVVAGWMALVRSAHVDGTGINDPLADVFGKIVDAMPDGDSYVAAMLGLDGVFGPQIAEQKRVVESVAGWYRGIRSNGIAACLQSAAMAGE